MNFDSKTLNALAVNLHGRRIGVINRISGDRYLYSFEDSYIEDANHPTLSLSFKGQSGGLVVPTRAVTGRLPAFFSNLLPEGHLREYLAAQAGVQSHREFFLLAALGADLPGALTITPMEPPTEASSESADNHPTRERFQEGAAFRFSLAGVQLKFSAIMETAGGLTIPAGGVGGSWIVKLPSNQFASRTNIRCWLLLERSALKCRERS
jgi:serine/threonine-protein kinase HipA